MEYRRRKTAIVTPRTPRAVVARPRFSTSARFIGPIQYKPKNSIPRGIANLEKYGVTYIRRKVFYDIGWSANIGYYDTVNLTGSNFGFGLNFQGNQISLNFGTTPVQAQFWQHVGTGLNFSEMQELFEEYMIDRVDMEVTCSTTARDNEAADQTFTKGQNPTIFAVIDYSDANAPNNISEILQDADCKSINSFDSTRKLTMSVKPKWQQIISLNSQQAATQDTYNMRPTRGFLSTDTGALSDHYGVKVYCAPVQNPLNDAVPEVSQVHRFMFTYHYKVRFTQ